MLGRSVFTAVITAAAVALLCGCGGGGSGPTPAAVPAPASPGTSAGSTATFPLDTSAHALATSDGFGATVAFGTPSSTPAGDSMTATISTAAPTGAASQSALRLPQSTSPTFFLYLTFRPFADVTFASLPSVTIALPPSISTANRQFFYAFSDGTPPQPLRTVGPATVGGQTLTFPSSPGSLALKAGVTYVFSFYATPIPPAPHIYVANQIQALSGPIGSAIVFPPGSAGNATPSATITGSNTGMSFPPPDIAVDQSGKIYLPVAGITTSVFVFAANANGNVVPVTTITGSATGLNLPSGLTLDASGKLYVVDQGNSTVTVYAAGAGGNASPIATIGGSATGLANPNKIALDASGNIYVTNFAGASASVTVYAKGANGNVAPMATISGGSTGLDAPDGVTVDPSGKLYVTNAGNDSVTVYAAGANGNVAPAATISGANTGLAGPEGVALDAAGNIYVANDGHAKNAGTLTIYPAGSNGNVAPSTTISGSNTGINNLRGVAVF